MNVYEYTWGRVGSSCAKEKIDNKLNMLRDKGLDGDQIITTICTLCKRIPKENTSFKPKIQYIYTYYMVQAKDKINIKKPVIS